MCNEYMLCGYPEYEEQKIYVPVDITGGYDLDSEGNLIELPRDPRTEELIQATQNLYGSIEKCIYCQSKMHLVPFERCVPQNPKKNFLEKLFTFRAKTKLHKKGRGYDDDVSVHVDQAYGPFKMARDSINIKIAECDVCGWWTIAMQINEDSMLWGLKDRYRILTGSAKKYDIRDSDVPINLLLSYLARNPKKMVNTHFSAFERVAQSCMKEYYGDCEVLHLGSNSGDGGVDLMVVRHNKDSVLIQVKRRRDIEKNEGITAVRELNGVLFKKGAAHGGVVTTAKGFTAGAYAEAREAAKTNRRYKMDFFAFDNIKELLNLTGARPEEGWRPPFETLKTETWGFPEYKQK